MCSSLTGREVSRIIEHPSALVHCHGLLLVAVSHIILLDDDHLDTLLGDINHVVLLVLLLLADLDTDRVILDELLDVLETWSGR